MLNRDITDTNSWINVHWNCNVLNSNYKIKRYRRASAHQSTHRVWREICMYSRPRQWRRMAQLHVATSLYPVKAAQDTWKRPGPAAQPATSLTHGLHETWQRYRLNFASEQCYTSDILLWIHLYTSRNITRLVKSKCVGLAGHSTDWNDGKCTHGFYRKNWRQETNWKT